MRRRKVIVPLEDAIKGVFRRHGNTTAVKMLDYTDGEETVENRFREAFNQPQLRLIRRRKSNNLEIEIFFDSIEDEALFRLTYL